MKLKYEEPRNSKGEIVYPKATKENLEKAWRFKKFSIVENSGVYLILSHKTEDGFRGSGYHYELGKCLTDIGYDKYEFNYLLSWKIIGLIDPYDLMGEPERNTKVIIGEEVRDPAKEQYYTDNLYGFACPVFEEEEQEVTMEEVNELFLKEKGYKVKIKE